MKPLLHPKTGLLSLFLCISCVQLAGQANSSPRPSTQSQSAPNIARHLTILGFTLGKSTLAEVEAKLGKSAVRRCSPGETARDEVCYLVGMGQTRVAFEADGCLDGFRVIASGLQRPCYRECPRASEATGEVQTEGGLKLGLTREQLIALLGPPKEIRGNKFTFQWESRQAMTKEEEERESKTFNTPITDAYWDVLDTIEVTLVDSKLVEFEVDHIVSY